MVPAKMMAFLLMFLFIPEARFVCQIQSSQGECEQCGVIGALEMDVEEIHHPPALAYLMAHRLRAIGKSVEVGKSFPTICHPVVEPLGALGGRERCNSDHRQAM